MGFVEIALPGGAVRIYQRSDTILEVKVSSPSLYISLLLVFPGHFEEKENRVGLAFIFVINDTLLL